jgi:hypothetical protein
MSSSYNDNEAYEADRLGSDSGKNKELAQAPMSAIQKRRAALEELDEAKFSVCPFSLSLFSCIPHISHPSAFSLADPIWRPHPPSVHHLAIIITISHYRDIMLTSSGSTPEHVS